MVSRSSVNQRSKGNDVPVLVITARDAIENRVEGLDVAPTTTW
jgi:DNA-binding response OmpR family regulator